MLSRRGFLNTAYATLPASILTGGSGDKPNLLLILARQWRQTFDLGESGLSLPNLEQLARSGMQFDRAYSACPSAAAAQTALLTGRYPFASGQPTIATQLKQSGYETELSVGIDSAIRFLKQKRQRPFGLIVAWDAAPRPSGSAALRNALTLRPNVPEDYQEQARTELAAYDECCRALDAEIGRLMRTLEEQRITDETIVVFTSDHGAMLGSQGLEGDGFPYEEATHVPLIIRFPRRLRSGHTDALVSTVDLMPTLLSLCGAEPPDGVQGMDLSAWLTRGEGTRPESIYSVGQLGTPEEWRMVVRGLDKLVVNRELNVTHLYNLGSDPFEMNDLLQDKTQDLKRDELKALLSEWMRRLGDGVDRSGLKKRDSR